MEFGQARGELFVAERSQFRAADRARAEAQLSPDCGCRHGVVTGDHPHLDARLARNAHRLDGFGAQRIDDADQSHEREVFGKGHRVGLRRSLLPGEVSHGDREDPQPVATELGVRLQDAVFRVRDRDDAVGGDNVRAAVDHDIRAALHRRQERFGSLERRVVEGHHELVCRVERHLGFARVGAAALFGIHAKLRGQDHERSLGGVADDNTGIRDRRIGVQA